MDQPKGFLDVVDAGGNPVQLEIQTHTLIPAGKLAENIKANLGRPIPRLVYREDLGRLMGEPLAVVGAGPSLRETVGRLREFRHILVCGSSHDFVVRQGIVPTYAIVCDGGEADKDNLSLPQRDTLYLLASQCSPALFDHLADYRVQMWHYRGQAAANDDEERELLNGEPSNGWGSSVTLVSIQICQMLGFQHLHFFGFDSCYGKDAAHHACDIAGFYEYQRIPVKLQGTDVTYVTDLALIEQANQFFRLLEAQHQFLHCTIHGDGLIAAMVKHGEPGLGEFVSLVE